MLDNLKKTEARQTADRSSAGDRFNAGGLRLRLPLAFYLRRAWLEPKRALAIVRDRTSAMVRMIIGPRLDLSGETRKASADFAFGDFARRLEPRVRTYPDPWRGLSCLRPHTGVLDAR